MPELQLCFNMNTTYNSTFQSHVETFQADAVTQTAIQTKTLINLQKGRGREKKNVCTDVGVKLAVALCKDSALLLCLFY